MSPSTAIAYQYSNAPTDPSSSSSGGGGGGGGGGGFASEWNNMDSGGLDFDLLAEYLLEDINAGGFDFGGPEASDSPPQQHQQSHQPSAAWGDDHAGVVTPGGSTSFVVDPPQQQQKQQYQRLGGVAADSRQRPPPPPEDDGDMSGELNQVQRMIVDRLAQEQRQHQGQQVTPSPVEDERQRQSPWPTQQQHQQPRPPPPATVAVVVRPPAAAAPQQPAHKRPRVDAPAAATTAIAAPLVGGMIAPPVKVGGSYSFASASASASIFHRHPASLGGGVGGGSVSFAQSSGDPSSFLLGGRQKSQAQQDRRRERNRILARRTRLRKKFFFESLQKDVADLQRENAALKSIARSRLRPEDATALLEGCDANDRLPVIDLEGVLGGDGLPMFPSGDESGGEMTRLDREDFSLIRSIQNSQQCFIITDPSLHDNPIVYASDDFLTLTGYSQEEVLGRNCRFLQGTGTDPYKIETIREAVESGEDCSVTLVNYTSDGEPFWNSLFVAALRDADNNIVNFIGVIVKVAGPEPGDSEYGKVLK